MTKHNNLINSALIAMLMFCSFLVFQQALLSAVHIWAISEIFNHCFLVLPIVGYLIYRKRFELYQAEVKPFYPAFLVILAILAIQVFATVGDIRVISHLALFTFIPLMVVGFLGLKASKVIAFPLFYILLAVPIGEELIPHLQSLTADMSVAMVRAVGIPVYRSGLYIDIPAGKFLVAEACSGISFLISSIAFGSLYAYLSFETIKGKAGFILLSIAVPIVANSIRVFGIITIAHVSSMQYAVGADHLVYGWFFYLLVLILLFFLGEKLSKNSKVRVLKQAENRSSSWSNYQLRTPALVMIATLVATFVWQNKVTSSDYSVQAYQFQPEINHRELTGNDIDSQFVGAEQSIYVQLLLNKVPYQVAIGAYPGNSNSEAISSLNELFDKKLWSIAGQMAPFTLPNSVRLSTKELVSSVGKSLAVVEFYTVNQRVFTNSTKAKLYETYQKFIGQHQYSLKVVISFDANTSVDQATNSRNIAELIKMINAGS